MDNLSAFIHFAPILKSVIWGGDKIATLKKIPDAPSNVGECWEVSAVPGAASVIDRGPLAGIDLISLAEMCPRELLGEGVIRRNNGNTSFPLLIKLIDAQGDLSVQVHPDDRLAAELGNDARGKAEMWHILHTDRDAKIYLGLNAPFSPEDYQESIADKSIMEHVNAYTPRPGDSFTIPAGRIHAIGAGNLLLEVQQSSDTTFRIYDYDRRDKDGKPRQLHTDLAKRAINFDDCIPGNCAPTQPAPDGTLASCQFFDVKRIELSEVPCRLADSTDSFLIVTSIGGDAILHCGGETVSIPVGDSILIPAQYAPAVTATGSATIILIHA